MVSVMTYGWVCPVCGKVNAPWVSQCTCKGKLPVPYEPTCNTGTTSVSPILDINSTYDPWVIDSSGKIHKIDDGPSDSTTNN